MYICMCIHIYIYMYIYSGDSFGRLARWPRPAKPVSKYVTKIHAPPPINVYSVYCILNNWCICITLSCGSQVPSA